MYRCIFLGIKPTCYLTPCVCHNRATVLTGSTSPEAIIASILAGKSSGSDISRTASYSVVLLFDPRIVGTDKNTQIYKYNTVLFPVRTLSSITAAQTLSYLFTSGCRGYSRKKKHAQQTLSQINNCCADTELFIHFRLPWLFQKTKPRKTHSPY